MNIQYYYSNNTDISEINAKLENIEEALTKLNNAIESGKYSPRDIILRAYLEKNKEMYKEIIKIMRAEKTNEEIKIIMGDRK